MQNINKKNFVTLTLQARCFLKHVTVGCKGPIVLLSENICVVIAKPLLKSNAETCFGFIQILKQKTDEVERQLEQARELKIDQ